MFWGMQKQGFLGLVCWSCQERLWGCLGSLRSRLGCILAPIFGVFWGPESKKGEKVKIELSSRRELHFGGPGRPRKR